MGIKCGIVGLPNVGKSTLFNALTQARIEAANYPFCTIEPNAGIVAVPDPRLNTLSDLVKPQKTIATTFEFVDIAGLVAGASTGEGLGNKFLANIRETDAIVHVVRCFNDDDITHVAGTISPADDIEVINTELLLADLETVDKALLRANKASKSGDKAAVAEVKRLATVRAGLDAGKPARSLELDLTTLQHLHLLTAKPTLYIANVDEEGFDNNPHLAIVQTIAEAEQAKVVTVCAAIEAEIATLEQAEREEFLTELGVTEPGLNRVIRAGYALLDLETYFTAGEKEVRAWTIRRNTLAPQAAAVIHTDFEKGFIRAEVISYTDFIAHQGEAGAKEAGKWRLEGKEYVVQDGDIMHFRFNV